MMFAGCAYGRPKVFRVALLGLERLRKIKDFDVLLAVSDEESSKVCDEFGIDYFEYENKPLGKKHNEVFKQAIEQYEHNYIIQFSDDDVMSNELFKEYLFIEEYNICEYIKPKGLYFYDTKTKKGLNFNPKNTFGAFRMFQKDMLQRVGYQYVIQFTQLIQIGGKVYNEGVNYSLPKYIADYYISKNVATKQAEYFELWNPEKNHALDFSSESKIIECNIPHTIVDLGEPQIIDIKSEQNIWSFEKYYTHSIDANMTNLMAIFGDAEKEALSVI